MNDLSQHEPDDELLSAYLDDELSADERALVESRLAADPAARQTLEHLRSVSQSVRDLPTEGIGRDLRDSILQRAEASRVARPESAKGVASPSPQPPAPSPQLPNVTIGRTARSWVWATVAIAAAVLIMVLNPGSEQNADLPHIAQNEKSSTETFSPPNGQLAQGQAADHESNWHAAPTTAMPEPPTAAAPASAPQGAVADGRGGIATESVSESAISNDQLTADSFAQQLPAEVAVEKVMPAAPAAAPPAAGLAAVVNQPVVVRVLAKRSAVEDNSFETLLRKYGIDVETTNRRLEAESSIASRKPAPAASARTQAPPADARAKEADWNDESKDRGPPHQQGVEKDADLELVLVDAPASTIYSCLSELNSDADNYLGISVDDASSIDKASAAATAAEEKQATDLSKFNRGVVPPMHGTSASGRFYGGYASEDDTYRFSQQEFYAQGGGLGGGEKGEGRGVIDERESDRGRARRLQPRAAGAPKKLDALSDVVANDTLPATDAKMKQRTNSERLALPASASDGERMQVLFVIRPSDDPVPSLKAKNQAE